MKKKFIHNIYIIDSVLIKVGYLVLIISLSNLICVIPPKLTSLQDSRLVMKCVIFGFLLIGSVIMLKYGYSFRKKERMINAILRHLETAIELSAQELIENTGYTVQQIEEAVQTINRLGLGYFVWNRETGIISDGRLRRRAIFIDNCPACGNRIGKNYPIGMDQIPLCPSCGSPLDVGKLNDLKFRELKEIEKINMTGAEENRPPKLSIVTLIILALFFWPGAILYIILKYRKSRV